ncbi:MAG: penicillin-binding protein [Spirochaetia bacterium]
MIEIYSRRRFFVFALLTVIFIFMLIANYAALMLDPGNTAEPPGIGTVTVERGPILDRNGKILALQTSLDTVTAWDPNVEHPRRTAEIAAESLGVDEDVVYESLTTPPDFTFIKRKITPTESERLKKRLGEEEIKGISFRTESSRNYPKETIASHVIGYVGLDNTGLDGIEYMFDPELSPEPEEGADKIYGNQVFLTLDLDLQFRMEEIAREAHQVNKTEGVILTVMDSYSGDILSMVSIPAYDPNVYSEFDSSSLKNRAITQLYEPGSVFKIFTISAFLELGGINTSSAFNTAGGYRGTGTEESGYRITDLGNYGVLTPEGILKYSSNVGAAMASDTVSEESFRFILSQFGFGEKTGISLNGEESGLLRELNEWSGRSKPTIAFGQEISVTALQMVSAATALANRGVLLRPHIVDRIVSPEGKLIRDYNREPVREVISPGTAETMLELLTSTTEPEGTAHRVAIDGLRISAKTGTAEIWNPDSGTYSDTDFVASCIAIFPTDSPRYIVYFAAVKPKGESYYGGRIAAPVVRKAILEIIEHYRLPANSETVLREEGVPVVKIPSLPELDAEVPDYTGLPKRVLLPLLDRTDITVEINGSGWVVSQDPAPGTPVKPGMTLTLELE